MTVKVRIVRPDPRSAVALGYVKGRVLEVAPEVAESWTKTGYAELVTERETAMAVPATQKAVTGKAKGRRTT